MILNSFISNEPNTSYTQDKKTEHPIRSVAKAISWRIVGTIDTLIIAWFITGQIAVALSISGVEMVTKMLLYYGHERIWNRIKWEKQ